MLTTFAGLIYAFVLVPNKIKHRGLKGTRKKLPQKLHKMLISYLKTVSFLKFHLVVYSLLKLLP